MVLLLLTVTVSVIIAVISEIKCPALLYEFITTCFYRILCSYYQWQLDYWKRRGIPGPPGTLFIGNMHSLTDITKPIGLLLREWTKIFGKVYGIQEGLRKSLVISNIDMIRELFMKKFEYFHGRKVCIFRLTLSKVSGV
ncbi:hypothetical protein OESDEN_11870 [Oesophagostomum dentatum]|uniref:Cytochrome P450 n=1 Tax=Oesophagostomum dentatum TaxID=61180 RepID=A0A0B1SSQ2_OESDE|nr:hypothetical protein OESDEN_11870 [Oesophagostomum dentatum]